MTFEQLLEAAREYYMTDGEKRAQIISFAFGNTHLDNPSITREDIERAYDKLHPKERDCGTQE